MYTPFCIVTHTTLPSQKYYFTFLLVIIPYSLTTLYFTQAVPPVPRRGPPSKTSSLEHPKPSEERCRVLYARLEQPRATEREPPPPRFRRGSQKGTLEDEPSVGTPHKGTWANARPTSSSSSAAATGPGVVYTELSLMDCRSRSLPLLDEVAVAESHSHWLKTPSHSRPDTSPGQPRRATHTLSLLDQRDVDARAAGRGVTNSNSLEKLSGPQLYHLAGGPVSGGSFGGSYSMAQSDNTARESEVTYAEVPRESVPRHFLDNTYEQIPDHKAQAWAEEQRMLGNTYESLDDLRTKQTNTASKVSS